MRFVNRDWRWGKLKEALFSSKFPGRKIGGAALKCSALVSPGPKNSSEIRQGGRIEERKNTLRMPSLCVRKQTELHRNAV